MPMHLSISLHKVQWAPIFLGYIMNCVAYRCFDFRTCSCLILWQTSVWLISQQPNVELLVCNRSFHASMKCLIQFVGNPKSCIKEVVKQKSGSKIIIWFHLNIFRTCFVLLRVWRCLGWFLEAQEFWHVVQNAGDIVKNCEKRWNEFCRALRGQGKTIPTESPSSTRSGTSSPTWQPRHLASFSYVSLVSRATLSYLSFCGQECGGTNKSNKS